MLLYGLTKLNLQAYADGVVISCPSSIGLRFILKKLEILLLKHSLVVNKVRTKALAFNKQGFNKFGAELFINR